MNVISDGEKSFLVVGGDSFLGIRLISHLKQQGHNVTATTRRKDTLSSDRIFLDIRDPGNFQVPESVECVFIVAGVTNYGQCETDPEAWSVNVESIPCLTSQFLKKGIFVFFVSTNSVFGGDLPWPGEDDNHYPTIAYSRQKSESEDAIRNQAKELGCLDQLAIVRLTKIVAASTLPFPQWLKEWENNQIVTPFTDLIFSPISLGHVAKSLGLMGDNPQAGNLHLSGVENISYFDFAKVLADRLGVPSSLIKPTTSVEMGVKVLYLPKYSGIGMKKTTNVTGVLPESVDSVVGYVVAEVNASKGVGKNS
jgi:dTDP-4-dehydrorhamnose reductase